MRINLILFCGLSICAFSLSAQEKAEYIVEYHTHIVVDGAIDDWANIDSTSEWTALVSYEEVPMPSYFKAAWDSTHLYLLIHFMEVNITSVAEKNHERIFQLDNCAEVFLDLGADGLQYYELQVNAGNIRWELSLDKAYREGGVAKDPDELAGLESHIQLSGTINDVTDLDKAWMLELAFPWSSLQKYYPQAILPDPNLPIAFNLSRVMQSETGQLYYTWSPMSEKNIHMPEQWGRLILMR